MTKPCPPELEAFKHEPADYEQPVEAVTVEEMAALEWCRQQAESIMSITAGCATTHGDPGGGLEMCNSIASDIAINLEMVGNTRTQANEAMRYLLDNLARAEGNYRHAHDLFGADDIRTGRAWDTMRRAGDKARAALSGDRA